MPPKANENNTRETQSSDLIQGTLEMLILKTLALEPMHGYGVGLRIEQVSGGVFRVNAGSLLPALSRMERAGNVKSEWRATENNRRSEILPAHFQRPESSLRRDGQVAATDQRHRTHSRSLIFQFPGQRAAEVHGQYALAGKHGGGGQIALSKKAIGK
jgi:hypothetical protein